MKVNFTIERAENGFILTHAEDHPMISKDTQKVLANTRDELFQLMIDTAKYYFPDRPFKKEEPAKKLVMKKK